MWLNDPDRTQLAFELLSITPIECDHGLQLTNLTQRIGLTRDDPRMVTRIGSRQLFDAVCTYIIGGKERRALVVGAHGGGKSRNLLHLLKRLMQANQLILYDESFSGQTFAFVPEEWILHYAVDPANRSMG